MGDGDGQAARSPIPAAPAAGGSNHTDARRGLSSGVIAGVLRPFRQQQRASGHDCRAVRTSSLCLCFSVVQSFFRRRDSDPVFPEKHLRPAIAALGDMVRLAGNDAAGEAAHGAGSRKGWLESIKYTVIGIQILFFVLLAALSAIGRGAAANDHIASAHTPIEVRYNYDAACKFLVEKLEQALGVINSSHKLRKLNALYHHPSGRAISVYSVELDWFYADYWSYDDRPVELDSIVNVSHVVLRGGVSNETVNGISERLSITGWPEGSGAVSFWCDDIKSVITSEKGQIVNIIINFDTLE